MIIKNKINIKAETVEEIKAFNILKSEIESRINAVAENKNNIDFNISFITDSKFDKDIYEINIVDNNLTIKAYGIRGFIFAIGHILRKSDVINNEIIIPDNISGKYVPDMKIRGHQLGYRTTPNTYDAWDYDQYRRYYLDLMFFGMNTVEHIPYQNGKSERNPLMKYDEEDFLVKACEIADEYDLDVSLWHPNYDNETDESAAKRRKELYSKLKRLNAVFIPGGDPGNLPADIFFSRCKAIFKAMKEVHPDTQLWPSVQAPHEYENWCDIFTEEINKLPDEISGVIYGPNHAFPLNEIRNRIPDKYPLRFYPDITHNVRCEYPVHYDKCDWHFSFNNNLSRECTNPRPFEYSKLHKETRDYFIGSVSYSEGITDDVNKCIWSSLDFEFNSDVEEALNDYCRLYFPGCNNKVIAKLIIGLEKNWENKPESNDNVTEVYTGLKKQMQINPELIDNWRFCQLYLRAVCDYLIKLKREQDISAIIYAEKAEKEEAINILSAPYSDETINLRTEIDSLCEKMFNLIGYQSSVEKYYANGWERGAILDTIDLPVSDRKYLLNLIKNGNDKQIKKAFHRTETDGFYYSVAHNGADLKNQKGEVYMNFQGDRPDTNDGTLPESQFNVYDNFSFRYEIGSLNKCDYILRVTWLNDKNETTDLEIKLNDNIIYHGPQFGEIDNENTFLNHRKFITAKYNIPKEFITEKNIIEFNEPTMGVMFAEFRIDKN